MFNTVLIAVDLNEPDRALKLIDAALPLIPEEGGVAHLLSVVPDSGMAIVGGSLSQDQIEGSMAAAKAAMAKLADGLAAQRSAESHVVQGTIYDQILKTADSVGADAIVIGAHRPELKDYLIGPNAARVARHASQSVLVVR